MRLLAFATLLTACPEKGPATITGAFADRFEGAALADHWHSTGGPYRVLSGRLNVSYAYNHPLWLRPRLPRDAEIRFTAESRSPDGDVKVELWGDGQSAATSKGAYTSSGYVLIHGGWKNRITVLARMDEHGKDRLERRDMKIETARVYRWRVVRRGSKLTWWIDDSLVHEMDDPAPLHGDGHAHLGFNDWESEVFFDDVEIKAL